MSCQLNVIFFGDSICFGQGVSIHAGWVPRLSLELEKLGKKNKKKITVINSAVNGNTTRQALERMPYDVQTNSADLMLVQFGMNDCNYWKSDIGLPRVSIDGFKANLSEIIDRARKFGAKKIILNTNHPTTRDKDIFSFTNVTYNESNQRYNSVIREVANEKGEVVELLDIEREVNTLLSSQNLDLRDMLLEDGLHLSLMGHDLYYQIVKEPVTRAIKDIITDMRN